MVRSSLPSLRGYSLKILTDHMLYYFQKNVVLDVQFLCTLSFISLLFWIC